MADKKKKEDKLAEEIFNEEAAAEAAEKVEAEQTEQEGKTAPQEDLQKEIEELRKMIEQNKQEKADIEVGEEVEEETDEMTEDDFLKYAKEAINAAVIDEDPTLLLQLIDQIAEVKAEEKLEEIMPYIRPFMLQDTLAKDVQEFFKENPEAKEYEEEMAKVVQQKPELIYDPGGNIRPNWPYKVYAIVLKQKITPASTAMKEAANIAGSLARTSQIPETDEDKLKKAIFGGAEKRKIFDY